MISNQMSMKQAAMYLAPGDEVRHIITAEKINELLDPLANLSPMVAGLDGVIHIVVTRQAILIVGINGLTGRPGVMRRALPRSTRLGPAAGRRQNQINLGGQRYKLSKKAVAAVVAADAELDRLVAEGQLAPPLPDGGGGPGVRPGAGAGSGAGFPPGPGFQPGPGGIPGPAPAVPGAPACPRCQVEVQPDWDWCHACGFDPEGRRPVG